MGLWAGVVEHDVGKGVAQVVAGVVAVEEDVGGGAGGEVEVGEGEESHRSFSCVWTFSTLRSRPISEL